MKLVIPFRCQPLELALAICIVCQLISSTHSATPESQVPDSKMRGDSSSERDDEKMSRAIKSSVRLKRALEPEGANLGAARQADTSQSNQSVPAAYPSFEAAFQGECSRNNNTNTNPCDHICLDLHDGTYECSCFYGFSLAVDGYSCTQPTNLEPLLSAAHAEAQTAAPASEIAGMASRDDKNRRRNSSAANWAPESGDGHEQAEAQLVLMHGHAIGPAWPAVETGDAWQQRQQQQQLQLQLQLQRLNSSKAADENRKLAGLPKQRRRQVSGSSRVPPSDRQQVVVVGQSFGSGRRAGQRSYRERQDSPSWSSPSSPSADEGNGANELNGSGGGLEDDAESEENDDDEDGDDLGRLESLPRSGKRDEDEGEDPDDGDEDEQNDAQVDAGRLGQTSDRILATEASRLFERRVGSRDGTRPKHRDDVNQADWSEADGSWIAQAKRFPDQTEAGDDQEEEPNEESLGLGQQSDNPQASSSVLPATHAHKWRPLASDPAGREGWPGDARELDRDRAGGSINWRHKLAGADMPANRAPAGQLQDRWAAPNLVGWRRQWRRRRRRPASERNELDQDDRDDDDEEGEGDTGDGPDYEKATGKISAGGKQRRPRWGQTADHEELELLASLVIKTMDDLKSLRSNWT